MTKGYTSTGSPSNFERSWELVLGHWDLIGIWLLGHWDFRYPGDTLDDDAMQTIPATTDADRHRSPWSTKQKVMRLLWALVQSTLFGLSPHTLYAWRATLLRMFGAKIGRNVRIRPSARIIIPWHLDIGDETSIGDHAIIYSLGPIRMGKFVTISQYAHLCAGTHDASKRAMTLIRSPIQLGDDSWIAADAFVGPGVTVGDRAIVGARASVFKDVPADAVVGGNPAKFIKTRAFHA